MGAGSGRIDTRFVVGFAVGFPVAGAVAGFAAALRWARTAASGLRWINQ